MLRKLLNMKTYIDNYFKDLIANQSFIESGWKLLRSGGYFIVFPHYWELIPIRLEKAIAGDKS